MKTDEIYIKQMLNAIDKIFRFANDISYEDFLNSEEKQSAIILQLIMIGELSKKISESTKNKIKLPWKEIAGFRNKAVHEYYQLDLDIVWNTINSDLLALKEELKSYIGKL